MYVCMHVCVCMYMYLYVCMCTHMFLFFSTKESEAIPEHPRKKSKPSVDSDSEAHCSKDLVRIDYFLFILINVHLNYRHQVIGTRLSSSRLTTWERYVSFDDLLYFYT